MGQSRATVTGSIQYHIHESPYGQSLQGHSEVLDPDVFRNRFVGFWIENISLVRYLDVGV